MDKTPAASRNRDPIEAVLYFLFSNWLLLVCLPVIAGAVAFAITLGGPRTFNANVRIPAPPVPIAAFDELWRNPQGPHDATVSTDGSVVVSHTAASEAEARDPIDAIQAATRVVAAEALAAAVERQMRLSDIADRLLEQTPAASPEGLANQATALAMVIQVDEAATRRASSLGQWSEVLDEQQVTVSSSNGSNRLVPFAAFSAFTLALAIAIARRLLSRARNGRHTG